MRSVPLPSTAAISFVRALALLVAALPGAAGAMSVHSLTGEQVWSVAMHVHGSFSEGTGSIEWQTQQAEAAGVDVIWWTDHDWRLARTNFTQGFDFETATYDPVANRIEQPDAAYPGETLYWEPQGGLNTVTQFTLVDSTAYEGTQSLRYSTAEDLPFGTFSPGAYLRQTASFYENHYSIASRVKLAFAILPETLDPADSRFVLDVKLSEHPSGADEIRYVVGSMAGEGPDSIPLSFTPGVWNVYEVDVMNDAIGLFSTGGADSLRVQDNALVSVSLGMDTRNGKVPVVFFDDYRIESDSTLTGDDMLDASRDMAAYYEPSYTGVGHFTGSEISRFRAQPHLNAFAPGHVLIDYGTHVFSDSLYYAIDQVHAQGGLVSLNHFFGPGIYADTTETETNKDARLLAAKIGLIGCRAYGVDMLEAGYRIRGGIDLARHLDLWDALVANTVFLTGTGVTDTHGPALFDGWGPHIPGNANFENNFVTWLYTQGSTETDFLAAMTSGRAFFGDPWIFGGTLDIVTPEGFRMGQVVLTDRTAQDVIVDVTGAPAGTEARLLQFEIRDNPPAPYTTLNVLADEILAAPVGGAISDTVHISTALSSFVRVELSDPTNGTWAISNPLHFVRSVPTTGIPPSRLGARANTANLLSGSDFDLSSIVFNHGPPPTLTMTGQEEIPGMGELVVDTGLLGKPAAVLGAASWSYSNGILTLRNFGGSSTVIAGWSPVDVPTPEVAAMELALEPGRPNPFGNGISTAFTMPSAGYATLDVYDVHGRRVRRLLRDWVPAGRRAVAWDGRDDAGSVVADGVYVLRLEAGGRELTTKAVKIR